jgi:hypothetical protein
MTTITTTITIFLTPLLLFGRSPEGSKKRQRKSSRSRKRRSKRRR